MEQPEPFSGVAEIDGCGCFAASQELKRLVGYLSEETYTYGELTGLEHLRFAGNMHEIPGDRLRARTDGMLGRFRPERVGKPDYPRVFARYETENRARYRFVASTVLASPR